MHQSNDGLSFRWWFAAAQPLVIKPLELRMRSTSRVKITRIVTAAGQEVAQLQRPHFSSLEIKTILIPELNRNEVREKLEQALLPAEQAGDRGGKEEHCKSEMCVG